MKKNKPINVVVQIDIQKGDKFNVFKKLMNDWAVKNKQNPINWKKASKTYIPFLITTKCCKSKLEIRGRSSFPLKDVKCKCGKCYLMKFKPKEPKCTNCWDKGYASELIGGYRIAPDFENDVEFRSGMREVKNYCKCAKGKRLKRNATNNRRRANRF